LVRTGAAIALAAITAASAGCGSGSAHGPTRFSSHVYPYTIELPAGWSALAATDELGAGQPPLTGPPITDVFGVRPDRRVSRMPLPALVIGAQPVQRGTSLDAWEEIVTGIVRFQKGCEPPPGGQRVAVGEEEGVLLRYPDCPTGSGLDHLWIAAVHRDRGYHIVWFNRPGHEVEDRKALDHILRRWQFDV
jgi:hypothetical protein